MKFLVQKLVRSLGYEIVRSSPALVFHSDHYLRHNARRLEHLASLHVPVAGLSVLEVGAGIGDHSHYYLDRGCTLTITEARPASLDYLRRRYPAQDVQFLDMDAPKALTSKPFDLVHCYGLLYHLKNPEQALEFLARNARQMLFLETCVLFGEGDRCDSFDDPKSDITKAWSGIGSLPTRSWVFQKLQTLFEHVYIPKTQPNHEEFPIDWVVREKHRSPTTRAVFIASRQELNNPALSPSLLPQQTRHE